MAADDESDAGGWPALKEEVDGECMRAEHCARVLTSLLSTELDPTDDEMDG